MFTIACLTRSTTADWRSDDYAQILIWRVNRVIAGVPRAGATSATALAALVTHGGSEGTGRRRVHPWPKDLNWWGNGCAVLRQLQRAHEWYWNCWQRELQVLWWGDTEAQSFFQGGLQTTLRAASCKRWVTMGWELKNGAELGQKIKWISADFLAFTVKKKSLASIIVYIYCLCLSLLHTCVHSILLWAPGECSEAQEAGEVSLRPRVNRRLLLRGGVGIAARAGWKNSAGKCRREHHWCLLFLCSMMFHALLGWWYLNHHLGGESNLCITTTLSTYVCFSCSWKNDDKC